MITVNLNFNAIKTVMIMEASLRSCHNGTSFLLNRFKGNGDDSNLNCMPDFRCELSNGACQNI